MADPLTHPGVPPIAVVIATRGACATLAAAVASALQSTESSFELCIVQQGDAELPDAAALRDARVRIVRAPDRGLAAARNVGAWHTSAPIIAFTDDDCEVDRQWLAGFLKAFEADPRLGVVFGSVRAPAYDRSSGFIQAYEVPGRTVARGVSQQWTINGIGACMAVRREAFDAIGGFDEEFGAGAALHAAEDNDLTLRALAAGFAVSETPEAVVTHFGFRAWSDAARIIDRYMFGLGAMHTKMIRLAGIAAARPALTLGWRWLAGRPKADMNQRPPRGTRLAAFLRGAQCAWRLPIDRTSGRFVSTPPVRDTIDPAFSHGRVRGGPSR